MTSGSASPLRRFPDAPPAIAALPVDARGFPVPAFVAWIDGEPDFRVIRPDVMVRAVQRKRCWVCGGPMGRMKAFVIGPMCSVNRISAEPPSHPPCAVFAAIHCPFLSRPLAKRPGIDDLIDKFGPMPTVPGEMLAHNPGVTLVWQSLRYSILRTADGWLFEIGPPNRLQWFREGRPATRAEVLESFDQGLPHLRAMAESEGVHAVKELEDRLKRALQLLPK